MITISLSSEGKPYIWDANDWLEIREKHRIVGELHGVLANLPLQDNCSGLPMSLLAEEVTLLLEKKIARVVRFPSLERCPGEGVLEVFKTHVKMTRDDQNQLMREERKQALTGLIDKIIEGRRRKLSGLDTKKKRNKSKKVKLEKGESREEGAEQSENVEDQAVKEEVLEPIDDAEREAVMQQELAKIPSLSKEHTLVQTFTAYPWLRPEDACPVEWTFPLTPNERIKYQTFKDLWEKGHYITSGHKFGGDFLVYPGDPVKFHSQFIVVCVDHMQSIPVLQLVRYGRISSSVRKTVVLASLPPDSCEIEYQSIKWPGSCLSLVD